MAGRHRKPPAWRRALSGLTRGRTGVTAARAAALQAEVVALRATVASLREDLETALARGTELAARLAAETGPAVETAPAPMPTLELPLVRLALAREAEPPLTREMALALAWPDRGEDTARVDIVLSDLPERPLLDPVLDRESELRDLAAEIAAAPDVTRRTA
jgi:hypothetical protein